MLEIWQVSCCPVHLTISVCVWVCPGNVARATCFEDFRTTHRPHTPITVVHPTFKAAYLARGLLQDDGEWDQCLSGSIGVQLPRSLRQLFASQLIFNNVTNLGWLWDSHKGALTEDFLHQARQVSGQKASTKEVYIASLPFVGLWWYKLCFAVFFELLPGNFSIEWPIVGFIVPESWSLSIIPHISFNEFYPDCVALVLPNR